jgi:DNA ligase D-like protein (predicted ligase)/DNA ligase D-like protein (predicted 3'-phosphoesterase)
MTPLYEPMLARSTEKAFTSKDWIFEIKWDGIRAISYINHSLSILSRNGKELKCNFPELEELKTLASNVVLDGEIVIMREGRADFQTLIERANAANPRDIEYMAGKFPATYVVFDILEKDGNSLVAVPLLERKRILAERLKESANVLLSLFVEAEGEAYYEAAVKKGIEGVMAKKKVSLYEPGVRSDSWLKIKKILVCDCVIFGYTKGTGSREATFGALLVGLYDQGKPVFVGKVGTGFSDSVMGSLLRAFEPLAVKEKTLEGADVPEEVTWLKPTLVCEVGYQSVTNDGKLRMARFRGLRVDKKPSECTVDQIKPAGLEQYTAKRDFAVTSEPMGVVPKPSEGRVFVVQEHHARRLHFDFRLEREGVLKSWAVPKGVPETDGDRRLAVETEDHPLDYAGFEGVIPPGQYGAGTVKIWDKGEYELKVWEEDKIEFSLSGQRLRGRYVLVRFKKAGEKQWVLLKAKDSL